MVATALHFPKVDHHSAVHVCARGSHAVPEERGRHEQLPEYATRRSDDSALILSATGDVSRFSVTGSAGTAPLYINGDLAIILRGAPRVDAGSLVSTRVWVTGWPARRGFRTSSMHCEHRTGAVNGGSGVPPQRKEAEKPMQSTALARVNPCYDLQGPTDDVRHVQLAGASVALPSRMQRWCRRRCRWFGRGGCREARRIVAQARSLQRSKVIVRLTTWWRGVARSACRKRQSIFRGP